MRHLRLRRQSAYSRTARVQTAKPFVFSCSLSPCQMNFRPYIIYNLTVLHCQLGHENKFFERTLSHFSSSNGYSKRRTSQAEGIFYETMALFMCSRADRGQHGGGSRCGIDTEHCFNTVAAAVAGRYFRRLSFRGQRPIPHSSVCARAEKKSVQNFCRLVMKTRLLRSIMPMRAERSHRFRRRSKAPISAWQAMAVSSSVSMRNVR